MVGFPSNDIAFNDFEIKIVKRLQTIFRFRKLIMCFDYFIGGHRFNFEFLWLKMKKCLFLKIMLNRVSDEGSDGPRNEESSPQLGSLDRHSSANFPPSTYLELDSVRTSQEYGKRGQQKPRVLFQTLRINIEELVQESQADKAKLKM